MKMNTKEKQRYNWRDCESWQIVGLYAAVERLAEGHRLKALLTQQVDTRTLNELMIY
jgi:hypothetical protein